MTAPARAAVEAWIKKHNIQSDYNALISDEAAEALVATMLTFAAAQRDEELDALAHLADHDGWVDANGMQVVDEIRARRKGPG